MTALPSPLESRRSGGALARGGRALILAELTASVVVLFVFPFLTRNLGIDGYGRLQFVMALGMLASIVADPGLGRVATRRSARRPEHVARLVARLQPLRCAAATTAGVLLVGLALALGASTEFVTLLSIQAAIIVAQSLSVDAYLMGLGATTWIGYARLVSSLAYGSCVLLFVRDASDARAVLVITLSCSVAFATLGTWRLRSLAGAFRWAPGVRPGRILLGEGIGYGLSSLMSLIYARIDVVMLRWLKGEAAVGLYSAAVRLTEAALASLGIVSGVIFPRAVTAGRLSPSKFSGYGQRALRLVFGIVLPVALGAAVAGGPILAWAAGPTFVDGDWVMAVLGMATLAGVVASIISTFGLAAHGRSRALLISTSAAALVNTVGNCLAIPLWGPAGAALTTVLAQTVVAGVALRATSGSLKLSLTGALAPWLPAGGLMLACVLATRIAGGTGGIQLGVGVATYVLGLTLMPRLRRGERRALRVLVGLPARREAP